MLLAGCGRPPSLQGSSVHEVDPSNGNALPTAFIFVDLSGREHRPFDDPAVKGATLIFITSDCPISNSYAPEYGRLAAVYEPRGVPVFLVHVDPDLTLDEAREHAREYQLKAPVVLDPRQEWIRNAGVTVTPEVAVFSRTGEVLYRGRIDDRYVGFGKRREHVTSRDLRTALDAIVDGHAVEESRTVAIGCAIPGLRIEEGTP